MARLGSLIPLIILFVVVGVVAFIGYSLYAWSNELTERGRSKLEKKNIGFTKEGGLRVGVKEMRDESYADKTQNVLVNVWNNAELPNYKSRLGWNSTQGGKSGSGSGASSSSTTSSPAPRPSVVAHTDRTASSSAANLSAPRPSARRTPSTPGGWD